MTYYMMMYLFLGLGCYYFLIMGVRQTIEVWKFISHEIGTWLAVRAATKAANAPTSNQSVRPPLAQRSKLWPKK